MKPETCIVSEYLHVFCDIYNDGFHKSLHQFVLNAGIYIYNSNCYRYASYPLSYANYFQHYKSCSTFSENVELLVGCQLGVTRQRGQSLLCQRVSQ